MATAATTPSLKSYDTGDNLIDVDMNKLNGYRRNGEEDTNKILIMNISIASTAGFTGSNTTTETIGDGEIVMPGFVRENERHNDDENRSDQAATRLGATDLIHCTNLLTMKYSITNYRSTPAERTSAAGSIEHKPIPILNIYL